MQNYNVFGDSQYSIEVSIIVQSLGMVGVFCTPCLILSSAYSSLLQHCLMLPYWLPMDMDSKTHKHEPLSLKVGGKRENAQDGKRKRMCKMCYGCEHKSRG